MKRKTKLKLFFPYCFISEKKLEASKTQLSKVTSKTLEHHTEVSDEKPQPKQNKTMQKE